MTTYNYLRTTILAMALAASASADPPPTAVEELVMYGVNNDPPVSLVRFAFNSATATVIGQLGGGWDDIETLTYIPQGPNKGFYASHNFNAAIRSKLLKIDPFTGEATPFAPDIGFPYVVGSVAWEKFPGEWVIIASSGRYVSGVGWSNRCIIEIDPATGIGIKVANVNQIYMGLARNSIGELYGVHGANASNQQRLHKILFANPGANGLPTIYGLNAASEPLVWNVLPNNNAYFEALEFAFGDLQSQIVVPGLPAGWATNGVLMGYDDVSDRFKVFNPNSPGGVVIYNPAFLAAYQTTDIEGIVFFTQKTDPYGAIIVDPHD